MTRMNPYENSTAVQKLKVFLKQDLPLKIAFMDIDSTMTLDNSSIITNTVRELLELQGYIIVFVTSRTEEILITEEQRELSPGLDRPLPHLGKDRHGFHFYKDPKQIEPPGILDPDIIISSTGTNILIKQAKGGYLIDEEYLSSLPKDYILWRTTIIKAIREINNDEHICELHPNEFTENYELGKTNVAPPRHRIELRFKTIKAKKLFVQHFKETIGQNLLSIQLTDDSNPLKQKYTLYVTPKNATKVNAVEDVVNKLCTALAVAPEKLTLLLAGDSYPDLAMGLYGGRQTQATFLLVGNSRLASFLVDEEIHEFADQSLKEIKKNLVAIDSQRDGLYFFVVRGSGLRTVIIADEAFPGTKGPDSILAYLKN